MTLVVVIVWHKCIKRRKPWGSISWAHVSCGFLGVWAAWKKDADLNFTYCGGLTQLIKKSEKAFFCYTMCCDSCEKGKINESALIVLISEVSFSFSSLYMWWKGQMWPRRRGGEKKWEGWSRGREGVTEKGREKRRIDKRQGDQTHSFLSPGDFTLSSTERWVPLCLSTSSLSSNFSHFPSTLIPPSVTLILLSSVPVITCIRPVSCFLIMGREQWTIGLLHISSCSLSLQFAAFREEKKVVLGLVRGHSNHNPLTKMCLAGAV